jgi:hypothetical protein
VNMPSRVILRVRLGRGTPRRGRFCLWQAQPVTVGCGEVKIFASGPCPLNSRPAVRIHHLGTPTFLKTGCFRWAGPVMRGLQ